MPKVVQDRKAYMDLYRDTLKQMTTQDLVKLSQRAPTGDKTVAIRSEIINRPGSAWLSMA